MARSIVSEETWEKLKPLIPPPKPRRFDHPGRKPIDDRTCLTGILFVLKTGIRWEEFPREMGCCGMTLWNRLREWNESGAWEKIQGILRENLEDAPQIDWERALRQGRRRGNTSVDAGVTSSRP